MTYKGIYNFYKSLEDNGIKNCVNLNEELIEYILTLDEIDFGEYVVFGYSLNVIKKYFSSNYRRKREVIEFLNNVEDITDEELFDCLDLILSQDEVEKQKQVRLALENVYIRSDKEALNLILIQPTCEQMEEMRLACVIEEIRNNKDVLNEIAAQRTWYKQRKLRLDYEDKIYNEEKAESIKTSLDDNLESIDSFIRIYEDLHPNIERILSKKYINRN